MQRSSSLTYAGLAEARAGVVTPTHFLTALNRLFVQIQGIAISLLKRANEGIEIMGIGVSIFLMAVGAILAFAIDVQNQSGFDLNTMGIILMIVGVIGLLASMTIFGSWRDRDGGRDVIVERR